MSVKSRKLNLIASLCAWGTSAVLNNNKKAIFITSYEDVMENWLQ